MWTTRLTSNSQLLPLGVASRHLETGTFAVPSRIRYAPTAEEPLSGFRIAVKDIYHIKGIPTSVCSRAYYETYPPPQRTAACVELLKQQKAVIVGTTKLAAFAATEEPIECVDFQAPWNPRADGYQSPAGSSSGSGAAIASYPWLDISIGSDSKNLRSTSSLSRIPTGKS
jgi:Asp-tRNA(Asn)/Glu-tRNA(Gln) amidotransferase A subunit family amidase